MPNLYHAPDGTLRPGDFCPFCGMNYLVWNPFKHGKDVCIPNEERVNQLRAANPPYGCKPHFTIPGVIKDED